MKLKTRWLATVGLTTLVLVAAGSLSKASQQMWNPEVAHAARVTASLLKGHAIRPIFLHRGNHLGSRTVAPLSLPLTHTELASYTLNQSFSSERPHTLPGTTSPSWSRDRTSQSTQSSKISVATTHITPWDAEPSNFQNWVGSVDGTVKQQTYQIKQLELQLAQEQYKAGKIAQSDLNEKAVNYQRAAQDFKLFLNSDKMAD